MIFCFGHAKLLHCLDASAGRTDNDCEIAVLEFLVHTG